MDIKASYGQFCPVAMAAAIFCTRWTPLILRELLCGSRHFNDLRRGLPRISPTLLSKRLKELQLAGGCPRNESSLKRIQYQQPNAPGWTTNGLPNFVSGIKMCGNDERSSNREKLKGIALSATQVATDGRFVNVGGELREERPNCRKWYAKVSCPAGQAAYGLQVLGSSSAKGIQLECAPLRR